MDKREVSLLKEIWTGYNQYIFYSLLDFKQDFGQVEHGRKGIVAYSQHNVNIKLNPITVENFRIHGIDLFKGRFLQENENSNVETKKDNVFLTDRSNESLVCSLNLPMFVNYLAFHKSYGDLIRRNNNQTYDLFFEKGVDLKPILGYNCAYENEVFVLGFHDENLTKKQESSLTDRISEFFSQNSFNN